MPKEYPRIILEFEQWFRTEEACRIYIARLRWPEGFRCRRCQHTEAWKMDRGLWRCKRCKNWESVTAGTVFHRSKLPLRIWFRAIWWVTNQKTGVNAMGLQRLLGLGSYETAWAVLHKLRRAMVRSGRELLSGKIELDETHVGGVRKGGSGKRHKNIVIIAAEVRGTGTGRIRLKRLQNDNKPNIVGFVKHAVAPGARIISDGWWPHTALTAHGYKIERTVMRGKGKEASSLLLPRVNLVASLLKRWILGTYQGRLSSNQLDHYLDEFAFRFNRRSSPARGMLFYRLAQQCVSLGPTPYRAISKNGRSNSSG